MQLSLQLGHARRRGLLPALGEGILQGLMWAPGMLATMAKLSEACCIWVLPLSSVLVLQCSKQRTSSVHKMKSKDLQPPLQAAD